MKKVTFKMYYRKLEKTVSFNYYYFSVNIASNKDKLQVIKSLVKR